MEAFFYLIDLENNSYIIFAPYFHGLLKREIATKFCFKQRKNLLIILFGVLQEFVPSIL
jgi:hypothetical protein